ncbi:MAG: type II toxin-antitoxin system PemK/MazF family toxin [Bacteroidetes bacterium]|nr:type II toxin-antitoxin system PemK/MazF family toxin [Bacteroidota bacterium]MBU1578444.1 type II toxin-antitoxin system PemK/MazF family toxin [Bacteroidota bacterium]MBU2557506.1 type II toxin-antitoxin system PemK/MazF family toxin [Bacteroidota bacterium]
MERFVKGDVIVIPFPFSDLTSSKKRPALVLSDLAGDDVILCQITSQFIKDNYVVAISDSDFINGSLHKPSNIRPNRLFTADKKLIERKIGSLKSVVYNKVVDKLHALIKK